MTGNAQAASVRVPGLSVSVPANLLLLGEYAVLEERGLGLALAPDARTTGRLRPGASSRVRGVFPGARASWPGDAGILGGVCDYLQSELGPLPGEAGIDTTALYDREGRKLGYGSSAAMTVALTAIWTRATGQPEARVAELAVRAHRAAQGGRGSGYDVVTSTIGGVVLFTGGEHPTARRVAPPWLPSIRVFAGADAVGTRGAVTRYVAWKADHAPEAERFLERSNDLVLRLLRIERWAEAYPLLVEYRELAAELGDRIGVPARIASPSRRGPGGASARADRIPDGTPPDAPVFCKAVGAGNELGVTLGGDTARPSADAPDTDAELPVVVAEDGLRWE